MRTLMNLVILTMLDYRLNADDNWTLDLRDFCNLAKGFSKQCYCGVSQLRPMNCQLVNEWLSKLNSQNVSKPRCHRDPNLTLSS